MLNDWQIAAGMNQRELSERCAQFAVRILKFADALPNRASGRTIASQIARSGCSVAANYRAALRGKSRADFINKITIVLEEVDETDLWIELAKRAGLVEPKRVEELQAEAVELIRIFSATRRTARVSKS